MTAISTALTFSEVFELRGSDFSAWTIHREVCEPGLKQFKDVVSQTAHFLEAWLKLRQSPPTPMQFDFVRDARDRWIYEQCCLFVPYKTILCSLVRQLKENPKAVDWELITSINGIKKAARTYAKRHGLLPPAERKAGRPRGNSAPAP